MFWRKITLIAGGPVLIGLLLILGHRHDLFYTTAWFDLFMHYLGGMLLIFTLAGTLWHLELMPPEHPALFKTGLIAALILTSVCWEVLEVYAGMVPNWSQSIYDTITDMASALAGGLTALLFIRP
ncbi:MAG: hypothetical protein JEZ10_06935 [Verrucomicrobia bacterium]|nr:hypothetical protein [Verrucomicrobiota bacterium]